MCVVFYVCGVNMYMEVIVHVEAGDGVGSFTSRALQCYVFEIGSVTEAHQFGYPDWLMTSGPPVSVILFLTPRLRLQPHAAMPGYILKPYFFFRL